MGLMIDKNGLPIGYELFSGNTFDSKTMVSTKRAKKDEYDRGRGLDKANSIILNNQKSSLTTTRSFKKFIQKETKAVKKYLY